MMLQIVWFLKILCSQYVEFIPSWNKWMTKMFPNSGPPLNKMNKPVSWSLFSYLILRREGAYSHPSPQMRVSRTFMATWGNSAIFLSLPCLKGWAKLPLRWMIFGLVFYFVYSPIFPLSSCGRFCIYMRRREISLTILFNDVSRLKLFSVVLIKYLHNWVKMTARIMHTSWSSLFTRSVKILLEELYLVSGLFYIGPIVYLWIFILGIISKIFSLSIQGYY